MNKAIKIALIATSIALTPIAASAANLLNTMEHRTNSLDALPKWQQVLHKISKERAGYLACADRPNLCTSGAMKAWQGMIADKRRAPPLAQLHAVNDFINQWHYREDQKNYGRSDYWASPNEFFQRSGDCEDYAISKYVTLRMMGFNADQLRLVVVKDTRREIAHAVLAAYIGRDIYILDNLSQQVRHHREVREYMPYYSVNEQARWAHATLAATSDGRSRSSSDAPAGGRLTAKMLFSKS